MTLICLDLIDYASKERAAFQREGGTFVERFEKGLFSIAVQMRVEGETDPIRVWLSCLPEALANLTFEELELQAIRDEDQIEQSYGLIAGMAVENFDGIRKGHRGKGVFTSLINGRSFEVSPPFWWLTGKVGVDRSTFSSQMLKNIRDDRVYSCDDLYRHPVGSDLATRLRGMDWSVHPGGFFVDPLDSGVQIEEAIFGPL